MTVTPYANREIDEKFVGVHDRLTDQDKKLDKILTQTTETNGKVRKITLALVATAALSVGMGFDNFDMLLSLFI